MSANLETRRLPIVKIRPDPTQARLSFDPAAMEDLQKSLHERGLLEPILVRETSGAYEIIAGERRFRAAVALGWQEIDCRVYPAETPALETELISLVENLQRVDLNPIEEARGFRQLANAPYNLTNRAIAKEIGRAEDYVSRALALLSLPAEIQESLAQAKLLPTHARLLAKITNVERQIALANRAVQEGWTVRELQKAIDAEEGDKKAGPKGNGSAPSSEAIAADPLRDTWPKLMAGLRMPTTDRWKVAYKGSGTWIFEVTVDTLTPRQGLSTWFQGMAGAFGGKEINAEAKALDDLTATMMPGSAEEFAQMEAESRRMRLPKNEAEMAELEALASQGPVAVYRWIYGPESLVARRMKGKNWQEAGCGDPVESVRGLVSQLRLIKDADPH